MTGRISMMYTVSVMKLLQKKERLGRDDRDFICFTRADEGRYHLFQVESFMALITMFI